jgi:hypothetical protein
MIIKVCMNFEFLIYVYELLLSKQHQHTVIFLNNNIINNMFNNKYYLNKF